MAFKFVKYYKEIADSLYEFKPISSYCKCTNI